jgi:hypothetical protein
MPKLDSAAIAAIKAYFEEGDKLTEAGFYALIDALAYAAEDHEHLEGGGPGTGTGNAGPVANLQHGWAANRPADPNPGDIWIEEDTSKLYICFTGGIWVTVFS